MTDLVEAPQALLGSFEEKYLELPTPVLIGVMKKHQRYFPVLRDQAAGGKGEEAGSESAIMLPHFITIANANALAHPEVVTTGNAGDPGALCRRGLFLSAGYRVPAGKLHAPFEHVDLP